MNIISNIINFNKRNEIYNIVKNSNVIQLENYIKKNGITIKHGSFLEINDINIIKELIKVKANIKYIQSIINNIKNKREHIISVFKKKSLDEFKKYVNNFNSIDELKDLNTRDFDILICAIDNNTSIETIQFIINTFKYTSMNYYIEGINVHDNRKSPLFFATSKNEFYIADLLIKYDANINYDDGNILRHLYLYRFLNEENLIYILNNGIKKNYVENLIVELMHPPIGNLGMNILYKNAVHYNAYQFIDVFLENEIRERKMIINQIENYERQEKCYDLS
ncbi:hypothetical protein PIROE2DRAFT_15611 [Piromyces sp. E2]|nr:hypothetical protein PIROE2DRAFT_15611 [Piromyces sp. E2]|eukprot:OUM58996.1 hypothetical protein PIROE2DRAFT_15611 [Piromyces sp. E2]